MQKMYFIWSVYSHVRTEHRSIVVIIQKPVIWLALKKNLSEVLKSKVEIRRNYEDQWNASTYIRLTCISGRSNCSQMFLKIGVLKNFAMFTGKHLSRNLILIKLQVLLFLYPLKTSFSDVFIAYKNDKMNIKMKGGKRGKEESTKISWL